MVNLFIIIGLPPLAYLINLAGLGVRATLYRQGTRTGRNGGAELATLLVHALSHIFVMIWAASVASRTLAGQLPSGPAEQAACYASGAFFLIFAIAPSLGPFWLKLSTKQI